jgi:nitrogen regulatory protein P-II 1
MKQIEAIVRPSRLDEVKEAIIELGAQGMTVSEVKCFSREEGHSEIHCGLKYSIDFLPKIKIRIVVSDEIVPQLVETIANSARTGKIGDGKVLVMSVEEVIRIRTGERGAEAI